MSGEINPTPAWNESERLKAVASYDILDTPKEGDFEDIVRMAALACNVPMSTITFIAKDKQWFKAEVGMGVRETPLDNSICARAILQPGLYVVPDTTKDDRFRNNPLVTGDPNLRFYAGALLESPEGLPLGTMCILDYKPRTLTENEAFTLKALARQVMTLLELRRALKAKNKSEERLRVANEQLGDRAAHLETLVQQRTEKLSETIHELEAFSYSVSHDMRAPLRSMIGYTEILKEDFGPKLEAEAVEYLNRIGNASKRMDHLIQDVLVLSRLSQNEAVLKPVDTDALIREVIHSYPNLHSDTVDIVIRSKLPPVMGNEALLTQCFSNLLENGAKFTAEGLKPQIDVWAELSPGRAKLFFKDNGIGMESHHLERIFDIFHRIGRDQEGTGIGLAIVRKATEKMGATVDVQSTPGEGSLFCLDLKTPDGITNFQ